MQVLTQKRNPWTVEQRTIIAEIVNDALSLEISANAIVGCVTNETRVLVIWNGGEQRQSFWFDLVWFREQVQQIQREQQITSVCSKRNMVATRGVNGTFIIEIKGSYLGVVGFGKNGWYVARKSGSGRPVYCRNVGDAILALWMLEVAAIAA